VIGRQSKPREEIETLSAQIVSLADALKRAKAAASGPGGAEPTSADLTSIEQKVTDLRAHKLEGKSARELEELTPAIEDALRTIRLMPDRPQADRLAEAITPWWNSWCDTVDTSLKSLRKTKARLERWWEPNLSTAYSSTRLGAILEAAADAQSKRDGIDFAVFLPHLREVLPAAAAEKMQTSFSSLAFFLNMASIGFAIGLLGGYLSLGEAPPAMYALFAVACIPFLATVFLVHRLAGAACAVALLFGAGTTWTTVGPVPIVPLLWLAGGGWLAASFYAVAVAGARDIAAITKTFFELYRLKVLETFGLRPPQSFDNEKAMWMALKEYVYGGGPPNSNVLVHVAQKVDESGVEDKIELYAAKQPIRRGTRVMPAQVECKAVSAASMHPLAVRSEGDVVGRVCLKNLRPNEPILEGFLCTEAEAAVMTCVSLSLPLGTAAGLAEAGSIVRMLDVSDRSESAIDKVRVLSASKPGAGRPQRRCNWLCPRAMRCGC
jgi:hypothetical protein